jgi:hypothetical protein
MHRAMRSPSSEQLRASGRVACGRLQLLQAHRHPGASRPARRASCGSLLTTLFTLKVAMRIAAANQAALRSFTAAVFLAAAFAAAEAFFAAGFGAVLVDSCTAPALEAFLAPPLRLRCQQLRQVDHLGTLPEWRFFLGLDHGLCLASLHLLVHQLHHGMLELVLEVLRLPLARSCSSTSCCGHLHLCRGDLRRLRTLQAGRSRPSARLDLVPPAHQVQHQHRP